MLALEARVPGGPSQFAHFFAVASYNLQHPSMFQPAAVAGLRRSLRDALEGRADVAELRRRARQAFDGPVRVIRRPDDTEPPRPLGWPTEWPMTVSDVCGVRPEEYEAQVTAWARAVAATLGDR